MRKYFNSFVFVGVALAIAGIIIPLLILLFTPQNQSSVGIIGGAGTTTLEMLIFQWRMSFYYTITRFGLATLIWGIVYQKFNKTIKENCTAMSCIISLGISASLAFSVYCFFVGAASEISKNPLSYRFGTIGVWVGLAVFVAVFILYTVLYLKNKKYKRIIFDIFIIVLSWEPIILLRGNIHDLLSYVARLIYN